MKMWLGKCTTVEGYSFWEREPTILYSDNYKNLFFDGCPKPANVAYGFGNVFPKLAIPSAGVIEIDVEELEDGYIIRRITK